MFGRTKLETRIAQLEAELDSYRRENEELKRDAACRPHHCLADLLPQTIYEMDLCGKLTFVNRNAYGMFGYSQSDFLSGIRAADLLVPEDRERGCMNMERILSGETSSGNEYTLLRKDGTRLPVMIYSERFMQDGKPAGLRGVIVDISEQKAIQRNLAESEKLYRVLADNISDVVWTLDLSGRFTYVSPAAQRLVGFEPYELMGRYAFDTMAPESRKEALEMFSEQLRRQLENPDPGYKGRITVQNQCKGGSTVWTEMEFRFLYGEDGKPNGVIGVGRDVTEQRRMQEELMESESVYRTLVENAPIGIYYNDFMGRFLYGNKKAEEIVGSCRGELIGKSFLEEKLLDASGIAKAAKLLALNAIGKSTGPDTFYLHRKDGGLRLVEINTCVTRIGGKRVVLGMVNDLTECRRLEDQKSHRLKLYEMMVEGLEPAQMLDYLETEGLIRIDRG